jgi:small subunit ribosomal protein S1
VEKVEDVLSVGEKVTAQVIALEQGERGVSIRLSLKALTAAPEAQEKAAPEKDEVLEGEVTRHVPNGVIVKTAKGEGLVPSRELDLPPGADHRRAYPLGRKLQVVLVSRDAQSGKLRFSVGQVADVVERKNYKDFSSAGGKTGGSLGSLGDLLAKKFGGAAAGAADKKGAAKRK